MLKKSELRVLIHPLLYKRFKHICIEMDLSIPKQTEALVRQFVDIQEDYLSKVQEAKRNITSTHKS